MSFLALRNEGLLGRKSENSEKKLASAPCMYAAIIKALKIFPKAVLSISYESSNLLTLTGRELFDDENSRNPA